MISVVQQQFTCVYLDDIALFLDKLREYFVIFNNFEYFKGFKLLKIEHFYQR
jgi:hypothetical protein